MTTSDPMKDVFAVVHTGEDANTEILSAAASLKKAVERAAAIMERQAGDHLIYIKVGNVEFLGSVEDYHALQVPDDGHEGTLAESIDEIRRDMHRDGETRVDVLAPVKP